VAIGGPLKKANHTGSWLQAELDSSDGGRVTGIWETGMETEVGSPTTASGFDIVSCRASRGTVKIIRRVPI
jgi:hypothetical protein